MTRDEPETIKLRSRRFRVERESDWLKLEVLLDRALSRSAKSLSSDELLEFPRAYRATLSALSVARATSLDKELINYLESLCTQAYFSSMERGQLSGKGFLLFLTRAGHERSGPFGVRPWLQHSSLLFRCLQRSC